MAESLALAPAVRSWSAKRANSLPRAVIFDLDGTLIDSVHDVAAALNEVLHGAGVAEFSNEEVKLFMGEGVLAVIRKAADARGLRESEAGLLQLKSQFLEVYCRDRVALTKTFPFASDVLGHLAAENVAVGVCTNKDEAVAWLILRHLGFDRRIGAVVGADSGFGRKPDPAPLLACASKLGVRPDQVVYVGDHRIDVETARAANIPVVAVDYGYSGVAAGSLGANRTIACLSELPAAVRGLAQTHDIVAGALGQERNL